MDPARILADLDDRQRLAVSTPAAPLRILAGAGSGKTRVLTRRIAYRVATESADPRHVLALTFTRKAAGELRTRLGSLGLRDDLAAGTFHAMAYAQLRSLWADRGQRPWTLVDRKVPIIAELLPRGTRGRAAVLDVVGEIEWAKARRVGAGDYEQAATAADRRPGVESSVVAGVFERYEETKRSRRLLDFDDLLDGWQRAIARGDDFARAQRWRFRHLFVDEFQDVNPLQHAVLEALVGDSADLCVVGDPRQAIYAWNGADARYLVDFDRYWPRGTTVELVDNYRSSPQVLDVASAVLNAPGARHAGVSGGASTQLRAHRPDGPAPTLTTHPDDAAEAAAIARRVRDSHLPGGRWGRQAVLVRTNAQTALVEQALRTAGVPVRVRSGGGLLDQPEVRDALRDLRRTTTTFATALTDLAATAAAAGSDRDPDGPEGADDRAANLETLVRLGRDYAALVPTADVGGFVAWLSTTSGGDDGGGDAVEIATFHAAKGLEWPVVHLAGLEDGLVPIGHARGAADAAEERRLFYVAATRAGEQLHCTWAAERTFGERKATRRRSPYLDEAVEAGAFPTAPERRRRTSAAPARDRSTRRRSRDGRAGGSAATSALATALRTWRAERARAAKAPAYTVFNDDTLEDLVARRPTSTTELLEVRGIGPIKASRFGDELLAIIAADDPSG